MNSCQIQHVLDESNAELLRLREQLAAASARQQHATLEAVGQLAGGMAHHFNNLLTIIIGYSEVLLTDLPAGQPHTHAVEEIRKAGDRAAALTWQMLAFCSKQHTMPQLVDLHELVERFLVRQLAPPNVAIDTNLEAGQRRVFVDPQQWEKVLGILWANAREAMPQGGRIVIRTHNPGATDSAAGAVILELRDTGCGMDESVQARLFQPFFTTKGLAQHGGLGLAVVHGIVQQSRGRIEVTSAPGHGTTIQIAVPLAGEMGATDRGGTLSAAS